MVADHTRDASIPAIASRILAAAPPFFALIGLSMGGYIAFEIMRQAPQRVAKLALLDTGARPETAEQTARRQGPMAMARAGKLIEVADESFVFLCIQIVTATSHSARWCEPWPRKPAPTPSCASNRPSWRGLTHGQGFPP